MAVHHCVPAYVVLDYFLCKTLITHSTCIAQFTTVKPYEFSNAASEQNVYHKHIFMAVHHCAYAYDLLNYASV